MRFRTLFFCTFFVSLFIISSYALAADQKSPTETYLDELHAQGKERVIVSFKDDAMVDTSLVDKYNGKLIFVFTIIKALVCEIPQDNIDLLREEESVKEVAPDILIKGQPEGDVPDPIEQNQFLRLKKEYFRNMQAARMTARREALQAYLHAIQNYLTEHRRILKLYSETLVKYARAGKKDKEIYRLQLARYQEMLRQCEQKRKEALLRYHDAIKASDNVYVKAISVWDAKVNESLNLLLYSGPVTMTWNNLSDGMNSKAAWDNYNLDGTGIKIAFLDSGVNYTLPDIDAHYLGGTDFVTPDDDPFTSDANERHGTEVVSIAVGEGELKVVGPAYNASYYAVRVVDATDTGLLSYAIQGIEWASTEPHKADIISMSLGAYDEDNAINPLWPYVKQELEAACNNAYNSGIILVAGSGNRSYDHSGYPAAFNNVISVGSHNVHQTISSFSNGGVDVVAPGESTEIGVPPNPGNAILAIGSSGGLYAVSGTSFSTPHISGLIALAMQYARDNHIQPNNGYLWELLKHSSKDMPLITDPNYKGSGKAWAAATDPSTLPPYMPDTGAIGAMERKWPIAYSFVYDNYVYLDESGYPAYYIGTNMYYDMTLYNNTHISARLPDAMANLDVTTTQAYYQQCDEVTMPGAAVEEFPRQYSSEVPGDLMYPDRQLALSDSYFLPWETNPGLNRIILDMEFQFAGNDRLVKVTYPYSSIWCPPPAINQGFPVQ